MRRLIVLMLAMAVAFATMFSAAAATVLDPFTQNELDTNWEADRQFPSDGVTSVTAFGGENVARIGVDSNETHETDFRRTEGIKTLGASNFGTSVQVDLYIDPDWQNKAVRAGFWVVGDDGAGGRDELFGIIEFVNNELCPPTDCSNQSNITDHEGWRMWDTVLDQWTDLDTEFEYGTWVTLTIELDTDAEMYHYLVNGEVVGSTPGGQNFIREMFLNSYNYGLDNFPNLSSDSYAAHWSAELVYVVGESTFVLCASPRGGQIRSPLSGQCGPGQIEVVTPSPEPLAFCINAYTNRVSYVPGRPCNSPHRVHVVPDDGDLLACVSVFTGLNRHVQSHAQCRLFEMPNLIPAGTEPLPTRT